MKDTRSREKEYKRALKFIETGDSVAVACKKAGLNVTTFYARRKKENQPKTSKKIQIMEVPVATSHGNGFIVFGSPQVLAEFARSYSQ